MAPDTHRALAVFVRRSLKGIVLAALATSGVLLTGCSVVRAVNKVAHDVEGNKATIDAFTNKMSSGNSDPVRSHLRDDRQRACDHHVRGPATEGSGVHGHPFRVDRHDGQRDQQLQDHRELFG